MPGFPLRWSLLPCKLWPRSAGSFAIPREWPTLPRLADSFLCLSACHDATHHSRPCSDLTISVRTSLPPSAPALLLSESELNIYQGGLLYLCQPPPPKGKGSCLLCTSHAPMPRPPHTLRSGTGPVRVRIVGRTGPVGKNGLLTFFLPIPSFCSCFFIC